MVTVREFLGARRCVIALEALWQICLPNLSLEERIRLLEIVSEVVLSKATRLVRPVAILDVLLHLRVLLFLRCPMLIFAPANSLDFEFAFLGQRTPFWHTAAAISREVFKSRATSIAHRRSAFHNGVADNSNSRV
jgi:hypothetical protein